MTETQMHEAEIVGYVPPTVLVPFNTRDQVAAMQTYQQGLAQILDASDWQDAGRGEKFVKKSGWRKIAAWFSLSIELVSDTVERADDGSVLRAQVWARAIAPNNRFADGDGYCAVDESRFARNKAKLENDLRGTASTRAINRAISNLVGMGAVSAEEVAAVDIGPTFGPACSPAQMGAARRAIGFMLSCKADDTEVDEVVKAIIAKSDGYLPVVSMQAVAAAAQALKSQAPAKTTEQPVDIVTDDDERAHENQVAAAVAKLAAAQAEEVTGEVV